MFLFLKYILGNKSGNSGVVLDDNLEIGCRDKSIQIITIQREGRTPKKAKEFMLGSSITKGSNLNNA